MRSSGVALRGRYRTFQPRKESLRLNAVAAVLSLFCLALTGRAYAEEGLALAAPAHAQLTTIRLTADRITFYYDRYLVEADGNVRVTTTSGMTITGDAFSMDLKLNRFLVAGDVHLTSPGGNLDGAAISDFLNFDRVYFVPVITEPDRWTYLNGDFTHPLKGREMPGDTFYFPNLSTSKPDLSARSATIGANTFVRFSHVTSYLFSVHVPMPSFYVYFGENQNLVQNSLSGASFDLTWNAAGNANSITGIHARYDSANGPYLSFEQHFAGAHEYAVFSDNPATKRQHFWNLFTGDSLTKTFQIHTFSQLFEDQRWFSEPYASSSVNYIFATQALHESYLSGTATLVNYKLIPTAPAIPNHPTQLQISATTFNHRIFHTPLYEQISYGMGFIHDSLTSLTPGAQPLQVYGGVDYTTIWNHNLNYTVYLPGLKFGDTDYTYKTYYFNASVSAGRTWYSVPHHVNTATTTASVSRQFSRQVHTYLSYTVNNTSDIYNHGGYSAYVPTVNGTPVFSFAAFRGAATLRTASLGMTYTTNPNLVATLTFDHHDDFPIAVPGLFPLPPLNNIGQYLYSNFLGQPPWDVSGDLRVRVLPHLVVDVQRTYYFHFGSEVWSPQFIVQLSQ
jgi:hypothetical protein